MLVLAIYDVLDRTVDVAKYLLYSVVHLGCNLRFELYLHCVSMEETEDSWIVTDRFLRVAAGHCEVVLDSHFFRRLLDATFYQL